MKHPRALVLLTIVLLLLSVISLSRKPTVIAQADSTKELAGLWQAKRRFGTEVRGTLFIRQTGGAWQAEIAARFADVTVEGDLVSF